MDLPEKMNEIEIGANILYWHIVLNNIFLLASTTIMKYVKLLNSSLKIQHRIHINQTFQMFLRVTIKCRDKSFADFNCLNASLS